MSDDGGTREKHPPRGRVVVVTGLSGAGKSTAIDALEDLGFFCVDNLPPPLVREALTSFAAGGVARVALGIDVRVGHFLDSAVSVFEAVPRDSYDLDIVFLDASDDALLRRFSSTRRPHPLSVAPEASKSLLAAEGSEAGAVLEGVRLERERLAGLRARASFVLDTTRLSVHDLRRSIVAAFGGQGAETRLRTRFLSFGFKYGLPIDADLVFDVRFLKNPYFEESLRELSGLDEPVRRYVAELPESAELTRRLEGLLCFLIPRFEEEGKAYLTVAIGCTGGRHRSVALTADLAARCGAALGRRFDLVHRDVHRVSDKLSLSAVEGATLSTHGSE